MYNLIFFNIIEHPKNARCTNKIAKSEKSLQFANKIIHALLNTSPKCFLTLEYRITKLFTYKSLLIKLPLSVCK